MKIPKEMCVMPGDILVKRADQLLIDLMLEYGIMVHLELKYRQVTIRDSLFNEISSRQEIDTIQFKVMDHTFETIKDLRTALNNKIFL